MRSRQAGLGVAAVMVFLLLLALGSWARAQNPVLYWGTSGWQVSRVQQRLASWGYYDGPIDGVFGNETARAVRSFQWRNGLVVDGIVGPKTWAALGFPSAPAAPVSRGYVSDRDAVILLARLITGEAADEPFEGKVAVGAVVLNRVRSASFPHTVAGVIFQPGAFESVSNGQIWRDLTTEAIRAAELAFSGWDPTGGALFFWNPAKPVSPWIWTRRILTQIGRHIFAV
uniref:Spore cortex-lytic enzyme n=1 Tax=Ammonifex degensii TaxID=42838 RepID=A0A7C2INY4_9THEO